LENFWPTMFTNKDSFQFWRNLFNVLKIEL